MLPASQDIREWGRLQEREITREGEITGDGKITRRNLQEREIRSSEILQSNPMFLLMLISFCVCLTFVRL